MSQCQIHPEWKSSSELFPVVYRRVYRDQDNNIIVLTTETELKPLDSIVSANDKNYEREFEQNGYIYSNPSADGQHTVTRSVIICDWVYSSVIRQSFTVQVFTDSSRIPDEHIHYQYQYVDDNQSTQIISGSVENEGNISNIPYNSQLILYSVDKYRDEQRAYNPIYTIDNKYYIYVRENREFRQEYEAVNAYQINDQIQIPYVQSWVISRWDDESQEFIELDNGSYYYDGDIIRIKYISIDNYLFSIGEEELREYETDNIIVDNSFNNFAVKLESLRPNVVGVFYTITFLALEDDEETPFVTRTGEYRYGTTVDIRDIYPSSFRYNNYVYSGRHVLDDMPQIVTNSATYRVRYRWKGGTTVTIQGPATQTIQYSQLHYSTDGKQNWFTIPLFDTNDATIECPYAGTLYYYYLHSFQKIGGTDSISGLRAVSHNADSASFHEIRGTAREADIYTKGSEIAPSTSATFHWDGEKPDQLRSFTINFASPVDGGFDAYPSITYSYSFSEGQTPKKITVPKYCRVWVDNISQQGSSFEPVYTAANPYIIDNEITNLNIFIKRV